MKVQFSRGLLFILILALVLGHTPISTTVDAAVTGAVIEERWYNIRNSGSGKYLNVAYNKNENNTNILVYTKDGTTGQEFYISKTSGQYTLSPKCSPDGKVVNIYGSAAAEGVNVMLWQQTGHSTQQWLFEPVSGGYVIRSVNNSQFVLTAASNANVMMSAFASGNQNQVWQLEPVGAASPSPAASQAPTPTAPPINGANIAAKWYNIRNSGSGKYLNVAYNKNENNTNILVYTKDGTTGQEFYISKTSGQYTLSPKCSPDGKVVNIYGSAAAEGVNVMLWQQTSHSTQQWLFEPVSGGYVIRSVNNSQFVLTAASNANVMMSAYASGNQNQVWQLEPVGAASPSPAASQAPTPTAPPINGANIAAKWYNIRNSGSGKYLNVAYNKNENNTNILVYTKDGTTGQEFYISKTSDQYTLSPKCSPDGKVVNIYGSAAAEGVNVMLWQQTGHSTQQWLFEPVSGGYVIRSVNNSQFVLTAASNANVMMSAYASGNQNQVWQLEPVGAASPSPAASQAQTPTGAVTPAPTQVPTPTAQISARADLPTQMASPTPIVKAPGSLSVKTLAPELQSGKLLLAATFSDLHEARSYGLCWGYSLDKMDQIVTGQYGLNRVETLISLPQSNVKIYYCGFYTLEYGKTVKGAVFDYNHVVTASPIQHLAPVKLDSYETQTISVQITPTPAKAIGLSIKPENGRYLDRGDMIHMDKISLVMINYKLSALDHAMNIPGEYEAQIWLVDEQDVRQTVAQFKLSVTQNVHYMPWVTMSNDRDRIKETQRMLNLLGYRAGPIDGSLGNLTKTQLLRFQYEYMADVPIQDYVVSVNERLYNRLAHVIISLINHKTLPDRRTYAVGDIKISDTKQLGMMWVYLADSATTYNPERWRLINSGNDKQFIYGENFKTVVYLNQPLRTELAVTLAYANDAFYAKHCHHIIVSSGYRSAQTQKEIWGKRWVLYGNQYFQKLLPVIRTIESKLAANQTTITEANQYRSCLVEKILVIDGKSQSLIDRVELPGRSNHSGGRAIDISDYGDMRKKELLERYGFINHSAEKWHFNYVQ